MSEHNDYTPAPHWSGHTSFKSARAAYNSNASRSYSKAKSSGKTTKDLVLPSIKTEAKTPIVILVDVTGSMGAWPATMFSKLPYLEHEAKEYFGDDIEFAWGAVGDYQYDSYWFQVQPFSKEAEIKDTLGKIVVEGGGGGDVQESYAHGALYCARNIEMSNAVNPILIMIGDEGFHDRISKEDAKTMHVDIEGRSIRAKEVFEELHRKFSTYLIRKPYHGNSFPDDLSEMSIGEKRIEEQWLDVFSEDRIIRLPNAERVVDSIFGIFAKETGRFDYFKEELEDRQRPDQVDTVFKSLKTVHMDELGDGSPKLLKSGNSKIHGMTKGKKTKPLM